MTNQRIVTPKSHLKFSDLYQMFREGMNQVSREGVDFRVGKRAWSEVGVNNRKSSNLHCTNHTDVLITRLFLLTFLLSSSIIVNETLLSVFSPKETLLNTLNIEIGARKIGISYTCLRRRK